MARPLSGNDIPQPPTDIASSQRPGKTKEIDKRVRTTAAKAISDPKQIESPSKSLSPQRIKRTPVGKVSAKTTKAARQQLSSSSSSRKSSGTVGNPSSSLFRQKAKDPAGKSSNQQTRFSSKPLERAKKTPVGSARTISAKTAKTVRQQPFVQKGKEAVTSSSSASTPPRRSTKTLTKGVFDPSKTPQPGRIPNVKNVLDLGGESFGIDVAMDRLCASSYLQKEHAEARKLLLPRAQEAVQHLLDSQDSLGRALKVFSSFPKRAHLQELSQNIAKKVLAQEIKSRTKFLAGETVSAAIDKLDPSKPLSSEEWEQIKGDVEKLLEDVDDLEGVLYDHYIGREENLWWLNAQQNAQKGDKPFTQWLMDVISAPSSADEKAQRLSNHMLHYLHFWYERAKHEEREPALSFHGFADDFKQQLAERKDPFGPGGILGWMIQEPGSGEPFHKICVGDELFAFGESLPIWYLREFSPSVRIEQLLTIINLRAQEFSMAILDFLRSDKKITPDITQLIQQELMKYLATLNNSSKKAVRKLVGGIDKIHEELAADLVMVCEREGDTSLLSGSKAIFQLVSSSEEDGD